MLIILSRPGRLRTLGNKCSRVGFGLGSFCIGIRFYLPNLLGRTSVWKMPTAKIVASHIIFGLMIVVGVYLLFGIWVADIDIDNGTVQNQT